MQIQHESLEAVKGMATIGVVAKLRSVSDSRKEGYWIAVDFTAVPIEIIYGKVASDNVLSFTYSQGIPHRRGDVTVSPLVTGSGLELKTKRGDHVILLLSAPDSTNTKRLQLLRMEPVGRIDSIRQLSKQRAESPQSA
ncbi:MAG: hypothetical protein ACR2RB_14630 [Gammaproteobacteria bacterium]